MRCIGLSNPASLNRLFLQDRVVPPSAATVFASTFGAWMLTSEIPKEKVWLLLNHETPAYVHLISKLIMNTCAASFQLIK